MMPLNMQLPVTRNFLFHSASHSQTHSVIVISPVRYRVLWPHKTVNKD